MERDKSNIEVVQTNDEIGSTTVMENEQSSIDVGQKKEEIVSATVIPFREELRAVLTELAMGVYLLASLMGISPVTIYNWLNGVNVLKSKKMFMKLLAATGVPAERFWIHHKFLSRPKAPKGKPRGKKGHGFRAGKWLREEWLLVLLYRCVQCTFKNRWGLGSSRLIASKAWHCVLDGRYCGTANTMFKKLWGFFRFAANVLGGNGRVSLALLADISPGTILYRFIHEQLLPSKADLSAFFVAALDLLDPEYGWVVRNGALLEKRIGTSTKPWEVRCAEAYRALEKFNEQASQEKGKNPPKKKAIRVKASAEKDPVRAVRVLCQRLWDAGTKALVGPIDRAVAIRECLLHSLIIFAAPTWEVLANLDWRLDGTGHLRRVANSTKWEIVFRGSPDANYRARKHSVRMELPDWMTPVIEEYLFVHRPALIKDRETDALFVPSVRGAETNLYYAAEGLLQVSQKAIQKWIGDIAEDGLTLCDIREMVIIGLIRSHGILHASKQLRLSAEYLKKKYGRFESRRSAQKAHRDDIDAAADRIGFGD